MNRCRFFDEDNVGVRYATWEAQSILRKDEAGLTDEERELRRKLQAFEEHFIECEECHMKVRKYQEIGYALEKLGGIEKQEGVGFPWIPKRWLAVAASVLFVSTISLCAWVAVLKQNAERMSRAKAPQTVTRLFSLEPAGPARRLPVTGIVRIPSSCPSYLLSVYLPKTEADPRRYELKIVDADMRELWKNEDAFPDPERGFLIHLAGGFLPPGDYSVEVHVFSRTDGREITKGSYPFLVESEENR